MVDHFSSDDIFHSVDLQQQAPVSPRLTTDLSEFRHILNDTQPCILCN